MVFTNDPMTEKDMKLIRQAESMNYLEIDEVAMLADRTDTEEARQRIEEVVKWLYHLDMAKSGLG